jgi:hypothetical protein
VVRHPLLRALEPVADRLGATIISKRRLIDGDVALSWEGEVVGGLRLPDLQDALSRLLVQVERELGARLADLPRTDKQRAVKLLDERGAFTLRGSIDEVADAMGVSRITIYTYLNVIRDRA